MQIPQIIIPLSMFGLMFGMGLTLTPADFRRIITVPKAIAVGVVLQLLVLPAIGFSLAHAFSLPPMLALGLVVIAACPGGTTSNIVVHMGKGDTALSISLTATATLISLLTLPLWINFSLTSFGQAETVVKMPILKTAVELGVFTILPVIVGMIVRNYRAELVNLEPSISKISTAAMIAALFATVMTGEGSSLSDSAMILVPSAAYVIIALILGYGMPRLAGLSEKTSSTIAVETTVKNLMLSMFLASTSLNSIEVAYASVLIGALMMPIGISIMLMYHLKAKRIEKAGASVL
ncbi:hypothetical protein HBA55_03915 [Pseudomaricurvus alkylphenolicus]|uniref:bile acid:sodium symporter family protein n=1 Tax=Pseudomaricurvus alkylphenolicus TaxID=1306991 RepID=UPI00141E6834|nr:hypothetical protein [Pseudomaricurvus alkylphenolicus]NIB38716.1 hypothetical protein [Pseudomaricurvus alkylphenolicus]